MTDDFDSSILLGLGAATFYANRPKTPSHASASGSTQTSVRGIHNLMQVPLGFQPEAVTRTYVENLLRSKSIRMSQMDTVLANHPDLISGVWDNLVTNRFGNKSPYIGQFAGAKNSDWISMRLAQMVSEPGAPSNLVPTVLSFMDNAEKLLAAHESWTKNPYVLAEDREAFDALVSDSDKLSHLGIFKPPETSPFDFSPIKAQSQWSSRTISLDDLPEEYREQALGLRKRLNEHSRHKYPMQITQESFQGSPMRYRVNYGSDLGITLYAPDNGVIRLGENASHVFAPGSFVVAGRNDLANPSSPEFQKLMKLDERMDWNQLRMHRVGQYMDTGLSPKEAFLRAEEDANELTTYLRAEAPGYTDNAGFADHSAMKKDMVHVLDRDSMKHLDAQTFSYLFREKEFQDQFRLASTKTSSVLPKTSTSYYNPFEEILDPARKPFAMANQRAVQGEATIRRPTMFVDEKILSDLRNELGLGEGVILSTPKFAKNKPVVAEQSRMHKLKSVRNDILEQLKPGELIPPQLVGMPLGFTVDGDLMSVPSGRFMSALPTKDAELEFISRKEAPIEDYFKTVGTVRETVRPLSKEEHKKAMEIMERHGVGDLFRHAELIIPSDSVKDPAYKALQVISYTEEPVKLPRGLQQLIADYGSLEAAMPEVQSLLRPNAGSEAELQLVRKRFNEKIASKVPSLLHAEELLGVDAKQMAEAMGLSFVDYEFESLRGAMGLPEAAQLMGLNPQEAAEKLNAAGMQYLPEKRSLRPEDFMYKVIPEEVMETAEREAAIISQAYPGTYYDSAHALLNFSYVREDRAMRHSENLQKLETISMNNLEHVGGGLYLNKVSQEEEMSLLGMIQNKLGDRQSQQLSHQDIADMMGYTRANGATGLGYSELHPITSFKMTGAGGRASLEPRAYISASAMGLKDILDEEIIPRQMIGADEAVEQRRGIERIMRSMASNAPPPPDATVMTAREIMSSPDFMEGGGYLKIHNPDSHYTRHVYIPSRTEMSAMQPKYVGGFPIPGSETAKTVRDMIRTVADYETGQIKFSDMISKMGFTGSPDSHFAALQAQGAALGKGEGSMMRGKVLGSKALRAADSAENLLRIHPEDLSDMLKDMQLSPSQIKEFMESADSGEGLGMLIARDPQIGPYSLQPTVVHTSDKVTRGTMQIPEVYKKARLRLPSGEVFEKTMRMGQMVGLAGDKDADNYKLFAMQNAENEEALRYLAESARHQDDYLAHMVFTQFATAKRMPEQTSLSMVDFVAGGQLKVMQGSDARIIGGISNVLTEARVGIAISDLSDARKQQSLAMLEFMEQQPISAKHLDANKVLTGEVSKIVTGVRDIISSGDVKNLDRFQETFRNLIRYSDRSDKEKEMLDTILSGKEFDLEIGGETKTLRGVNIREALGDILSARGDMTKRIGSTGVSPLDIQHFLMNKAEVTPDKASRIMDVLSNATPQARGANTAAQNLADISRKMGEYKRPAAMALGAMAIGAVLLSGGSPTPGEERQRIVTERENAPLARQQALSMEVRGATSDSQRKQLATLLQNTYPNSTFSMQIQDRRRRGSRLD